MKTLLALLLLCASAFAADVQTSLAWDANGEPDLAGYRLYYGTAKGVYSQSVEVPAGTTTAAIKLPSGTMVFCAVTVFNTTGLESLPSAELVFQNALPGDRKPPAAPKGLRVIGAVTVALEKSEDLRTWTPIYITQITTPWKEMFLRATMSQSSR